MCGLNDCTTETDSENYRFFVFFFKAEQNSVAIMRFEPTVRRTKSLRTAGGQTMTEENYNYRSSQTLWFTTLAFAGFYI